ncbi:MAG: tyrosine recombinase XerC [Akkermansiaceae bacterium]
MNTPFIKEYVDLPSPLPFEDVQPEKVGSLRYHSRIDAEKLMGLAEVELKEGHPEPYKVFLLALVCGLRVSEIDHLLWESIDLDECTLHVRSTEYHQLKSDDSEGVIDLGESVCSYLELSVTDAEDDFVITVSAGDEVAPSAPYRCQKHLNFLREWLRLKGVKVQKPIHTLRKEVGSLIASEQGIFAASRYLRHADIQVTAAFYADKKNKIVPSLSQSVSSVLH